MKLIRAAALALLLSLGLASALTSPPAEPAPSHGDGVIEFRPATPAESLIHQLEQAYERDQIRVGQR